MNEQQALAKMVAPGTRRLGKYREGVIQIWVTRACDKACFNCTQASNMRGNPGMITLEQFEQAVQSLKGYWGVVGMFGGNPAMHPQFPELCEILRKHIPYEQRGLWSNNPLGHGKVMRETFNPAVSNINVHLDRKAYDEFKRDWPECHPVGLTQDSRHSPVFVAMRDMLKKPCPDCSGQSKVTQYEDVFDSYDCETCGSTGQVYDEEKAWELISDCDINKHWSAMIGVFRGEVRAWFCEIAGAQAMLHQHEPDYPDTGLDPSLRYTDGSADGFVINSEEDDSLWESGLLWWELPMFAFRHQVRKHCHECSVPLRGYGELAQAKEGVEQVSQTHADVCRPKTAGRPVQIVTTLEQLKAQALPKFTQYLQNSNR